MKSTLRSIAVATCLFGSVVGTTSALDLKADSLVAVDRNRTAVIEQIITQFKGGFAPGQEKVVRETLKTLRADHLLAASLAPNLDGLVAMIKASDGGVGASPIKPKDLGDPTIDLVYTPVTPCRVFDTRGSQGGLGPLSPGVTRTYSATTPVPQQAGVGGCTAPVGTAVAMIQLTAIGATGVGLLQGGANGTGPFASSLILYQPGDSYGASIPMPVLVANGRFDLIAQFNGVEVAGDLLGYFAEPEATALQCTTTLDTSQTIPTNFSNLLTSAQACATGYAMTGGGCAWLGNALAVYVAKVELSAGTAVRCAYNNFTGSPQTAWMETRCCRVPGR